MISILTPRYIKSEWCIKEVTEFHQVCQQNLGFVVKNKARVFKVIKTPVNTELHPDVIKNILGYEFYGTDPNTNRVKEFSPIFSHTEKGYWEKLDDLANDICVFLEELKATTLPSGNAMPVNAPSIKASPAQQAGNNNRKVKNIFLAESSYDTRDLRDSLKRELQDHGYTILPYGQLSLVANELKANVSEFMQQSQLAIHLIGNGYGVVPEGTEKSIVEIQNEIGASNSLSGDMPRLIWIPENNDPSDERQKRFIQELANGKREAIAGADVVKGAIEDFKSVVHDKLKSMEQVNEPEVKKQEAVAEEEMTSKMVYLICDMEDMETIRPLEDFLFENGVEVVLPIFEGDETQIREDHIENLKNCKGVIIFYGNGSELWLRTKMRDFMKINGYGRTTPLSFKGVYISGPASPTKQRFRTLEAEVINGIEGLPMNELKNLLLKL